MAYTDEQKVNIADAALACTVQVAPSGRRVYLTDGRSENYACHLVPMLLGFAEQPSTVAYVKSAAKTKLADTLIDSKVEKFSCGTRVAFKTHGDVFYAFQLIDYLKKEYNYDSSIR